MHGDKTELAAMTAKSFLREPCAHGEGTTKSPDECISSLVGSLNKGKYFICTQDRGLRASLRDLGCVPLLYYRDGILHMESPSDESKVKHMLKEAKKTDLTHADKSYIKVHREEIEEFKKEEK